MPTPYFRYAMFRTILLNVTSCKSSIKSAMSTNSQRCGVLVQSIISRKFCKQTFTSWTEIGGPLNEPNNMF